MTTTTATKAKPARAAAAVTAAPIEQAVAVGKETVETMVKASQDVANQNVEKAAELTRKQVAAAAKAQDEAFKSYEGLVASAKENVDALIASGTIVSKGLQDIAKTVLNLAQESVETSVAASREIMAARTLRDLFDLQTAAMRQSLDRLLSEGVRLSDAAVRMVEDATAPLNARAYATIDQMTKTTR